MDKNGNGSAARIENLKERMKQLEAVLAAEQLKKQKREKRDAEKEQGIIGAAVVKAAALSPDFRAMIAQTTLVNVTDEKQRRFLADRGWNV